jgi:triphosphoribosyl-dephospho-CoA synthase
VTSGLSPDRVSQLFLDACLAELDALKPGNVHRFASGHGMSVDDFEKSAAAAAPAIGGAGLTVGARIEQAVEATKEAASQNTNLGIVLLAAPLAQAALTPLPGDLRGRLGAVLDQLTVEDACAAYRAIRTAEPGGLGKAPEHDVAGQPRVTLLEAMRAAERKDRIAWNYTHGFVDIFGLGLKWLEGARKRWGPVPWVTTYVFMGFLAHIPDTLIERKFGSDAASAVREEARPIEASFSQCSAPEDMVGPLQAFDAALKKRGLNPGTTADLTVATLFAAALEEG